MTDVFVFDPSALIALFRAYPPVYRLFAAADAGSAQLVFPAAAIAEANTYIRASESAWSPLVSEWVEVTPLTMHIAIWCGPQPESLGVRHAVYESIAVRGDLVTLERDRYSPWTLPLLVL